MTSTPSATKEVSGTIRGTSHSSQSSTAAPHLNSCHFQKTWSRKSTCDELSVRVRVHVHVPMMEVETEDVVVFVEALEAAADYRAAEAYVEHA